ncbi:MAG: glycosyltransferase family 2 protein [Spirosomataceae bacterium]
MIENQLDISIIIVNYKTPELIIRCVESISAYVRDVSYEIIVVNNVAKGDDKHAILSRFPLVKWLETGYNAGFGRANNLGMREAAGKTILLLNSDTYLIDDSVQVCYKQLMADNDVAAAGAYQLFPDLTPRPFYHTFTFQRTFWIVPTSFQFILEKLIPQKKYTDNQQVDYIAAAFLMVKKEVVESVGGFDEEFFLYGEDVEWSCRLAQKGKLLVYKNCQIVHEEWGSKPERFEMADQRSYVNRFDPQIQLSNLVWVRKYYGVTYFVALMAHYWFIAGVFYFFKVGINCIKGKPMASNLDNQKKFLSTVLLFSSYFNRILWLRPTFYKIEN